MGVRRSGRAISRAFRLRWVFVFGLVGALLPVGPNPLPMLASAAERAALPGLKVIGELPHPQYDGIRGGQIVAVDDAARKMYYTYFNIADGDDHLVEYDLRAELPRRTRDRRLDVEVSGLTGSDLGGSPYTVSLDTKRHRLVFLRLVELNPSAATVVDIKKMKVVGRWNLAEELPGFVPLGGAYSRRDDVYYMVGEFWGPYFAFLTTSEPAGPLTSLVALDPATGELRWVRPVPQCQRVLYSVHVGSLVAASARRPQVYFACITGGTLGARYPGQAGLVRLTVAPGAGPQDAATFPLEFFPISGLYVTGNGRTGIAGFDPGRDRFFLQSLTWATPGVWVFDGDMSAWVGFLAAPDHFNSWLGVNEGTGRYYIGSGRANGGSDYLIATDGRATPVPQGRLYRRTVDGYIPTDARTDRLFVPVWEEEENHYRWFVLQDETPLSGPLRPPGYDAQTADLPEGPNTVTSFSGGVNGFGARLQLVGGYGALLGVDDPLGRLRPGDRGFTAARVPRLDLREVGASATAQALVSDTNTEAELQGSGVGPLPWEPATCLDGSGDRVENEAPPAPGGRASVTCDLKKEEASASAAYGPLDVEGVSVASSSFDAMIHRDPKLGIVTETTAVARGVELSTPQGSVSIARVSATAWTAAHGRPKTTKARWERVLSGIEIRDEDGHLLTQPIGECASSDEEDLCGPVVEVINDVLEMKMRVDLFEPEVTETPRGAFAGVRQSDADFYNGRTVYNQGTTFAGEAASQATPALQVTVFNDGVQRSRLVVQLAAIEATSIYTISPLPPSDPAPEPPLPDLDVQAPNVPSTGGTLSVNPPRFNPVTHLDTDVAPPVPGQIATAAGSQEEETTLAFLTRSPKEALLMAGLWLLFGAAAWSSLRRRSLLAALRGWRQ